MTGPMVDSCPNCGHRKKPYLMATHSDAAGLGGLLRGEGDPLMRRVAWLGVLLIAVLVVAALFAVAGIHP